MIDMRLGDCMDLMRAAPDKAWDLGIVDPQYGINATAPRLSGVIKGDKGGVRSKKGRLSQGAGKLKNRILQTMEKDWDDKPPPPEYFAELRRVTKNQIIWGGNYFDLGPTRCVICWDKEQPWENFSQWEMAWTSFDYPASMFRLTNCGPGEAGQKIHPTQKPVALYKWLLTKYAKPGQTILDTHGGSGSHCIAAHDLGFDLTWIEKDPDYFEAATKRYQTHAAQLHLFDPKAETKPDTLTLDL